MNTEIKRRIEKMLMAVVEDPAGSWDRVANFANELGGKFLGCPSNVSSCKKELKKSHKIQYGKARQGYEKIKAQPHYDFPAYVIEVPIKKAEKMILLGWTP